MKRVIGFILMLVLFLMVPPAQAQEWQMPQGRGYELNTGQIQPNSMVPTTIQGPYAVIAVQKEGGTVYVFLHDESYLYCTSSNCYATLSAIGTTALIGARPIILKFQVDSLVGYQMN